MGKQPALLRAALRGLCPRCGAGTLFRGLVRFAPRCRACGLDFNQFNVGDGPAAFLVLILGAVIVGLAAVLEVKFGAPRLLQVFLWLAVAVVGTFVLLRMAKAALLAIEYRTKAREGRLDDGDE